MKYRFPIYSLLLFILFSSCSSPRFISRSAKALRDDEILKEAHVGIHLYDAGKAKNIYSYQADKYFIPASNTKIFTLYAALRSIGDSIPGLRFRETADTLFIIPTGDPTLLHPDFPSQQVVSRLQKVTKPIVLELTGDSIQPYGVGWSWDDYNSSYMAERNAMPVYGNLVRWIQSAQSHEQEELQGQMQTFVFSEPDVSWKVRFIEDTSNKSFRVSRRRDENYFEVHQGTESLSVQSVPFITHGVQSALELLKDTVHQDIVTVDRKAVRSYQTIYTQRSDSLYRLMMHNSDNFFAEQLLLMAANEQFGVMDEEKIITHLLDSALKQLPQRPRWVDGSGLSRYNLFTPGAFVWMLNLMQKSFGMDRLKSIFAGANQGTLEGYYSGHEGQIFAKTGTLSANVALSGFLITNKKRLLVFSILVNNHQSSASEVRGKLESFLKNILKNY